MKLVLLGDIHAYRLGLMPWHLLGKRMLGQANLWLKRRKRFDLTLLPAIVDRVVSLEPDMVLLSGDLTTTAMSGEFSDVKRLLQPIVERFPVVAVPGNHDRYTFAAMRGRRIEKLLGEIVPKAFPYERALCPGWRLLAIDSGRPNFISSRGQIRDEQLAAAKQMLRQVPPGEAVVVLCHYPAFIPDAVADHDTWNRGLADVVAWREVLASCPGKVFYLHGHIHQPWQTTSLMRQEKVIESINAGAPCMTTAQHALGQGFWEISLPSDPSSPLDLVRHEMRGEHPARRSPLWANPDVPSVV